MPKEFIIRGQTASGETEILNFGGHTPGYAYQLREFLLYPSTDLPSQAMEFTGSITAATTAMAPTDPNFNTPGLIATAMLNHGNGPDDPNGLNYAVIDDLFLITQDLILMVQDSHSTPVNWQCKFEKVKLSGAAEAVANFKQFTIFDD